MGRSRFLFGSAWAVWLGFAGCTSEPTSGGGSVTGPTAPAGAANLDGTADNLGNAGASSMDASGGAPSDGAGGAAVVTEEMPPSLDDFPPEPDPNSIAFECDPAVPAVGARRLWRLRGPQFVESYHRVYSDLRIDSPKGVAAPFDYVNPADRFSTFSRSYGMNSAELDSAWDVASFVANDMAQQLVDNADCFQDGTAEEACLLDLTQTALSSAQRRAANESEAQAMAAAALAQREQLGTQETLSTILQTIFLSPAFLFRAEIGSELENGVAQLTPHEMAAAVSYTLHHEPPDDALVAAAEQGREALAAEVQARLELLHEVAPVLQMIREHFHYPKVAAQFKEPEILPVGRRVDLGKDTDKLVSVVLEESGHQGFFHELLSYSDVWVSQDTWKWYGVDEAKTHTKQLRTPPPNQRRGILTQASFLAYYADFELTHPVQRGRFILESMLCRTVPDLPIDVVPALPDLGPNATMREKLSQHSADPKCNACHQLMDPLGLAFEHYDLYGQYRTEENGQPLDSSGVLNFSGNQDGPFSNVQELLQKLADSEKVEECFVRHAFRYWMGRNERQGDGCALVAARDAYRQSGGDLAALIASFYAAPSFSERALEFPE